MMATAKNWRLHSTLVEVTVLHCAAVKSEHNSSEAGMSNRFQIGQ